MLRQDLKQRPWRSGAYLLVPLGLFKLLYYTTQDTFLWMELLTNGICCTISILNKEDAQQVCLYSNLIEHGFNRGCLFSDDLDLWQVSIKRINLKRTAVIEQNGECCRIGMLSDDILNLRAGSYVSVYTFLKEFPKTHKDSSLHIEVVT